MSNERSQDQSLVPTGKEVLGSTEIDKNAFRLIEGFKVAFQNTRSFQGELAQVYFGQLDYGYQLRPDQARQVGLWVGSVFFYVDYSFTESTQTLAFDRNTWKDKVEVTDETLLLKSRRFNYLDPDPEARLRYFLLPLNLRETHSLEEGNLAALNKADEMLADTAKKMQSGLLVEASGSRVDLIDSFLGGLRLTRGELLAMGNDERTRTVNRLKRIAAIAFHPNNGILQEEARLKAINDFLDSMVDKLK